PSSMRHPGRRRPRLVSVALACLVAAATAGSAVASSTESRVARERGRVARLARSITAAEAEASRQEAGLHRVLVTLAGDESAYRTVQSKLMTTRASLAAA